MPLDEAMVTSNSLATHLARQRLRVIIWPLIGQENGYKHFSDASLSKRMVARISQASHWPREWLHLWPLIGQENGYKHFAGPSLAKRMVTSIYQASHLADQLPSAGMVRGAGGWCVGCVCGVVCWEDSPFSVDRVGDGGVGLKNSFGGRGGRGVYIYIC